jgi:hypothetical protein
MRQFLSRFFADFSEQRTFMVLFLASLVVRGQARLKEERLIPNPQRQRKTR